jgi:hypothetical protein
MQETFPWGDNRRFYSYRRYFQKIFGGRVQKLSVDAGFGCPNRDGTKGNGGCTYCNNEAFNPSYCSPAKSITVQLEEGKSFHAWRYRRSVKYLAYFQPFSNTYAPLEQLKAVYEEALKVPDIVGLVISTRPDCLGDDKWEYLAALARRCHLHLEVGIESCNDTTLSRINRGHTFAETVEAVKMAGRKGIPVGGHLIFGLPGETRVDMLQQAEILSRLPFTTLKFHQLQIIRGTAMEKDYLENPLNYTLFEKNEYIDFIIRFIEKLRPDIVIERFTAEAPPAMLVAPDWGLERADALLVRIENEMKKLQTWQGRLYTPDKKFC